MKKPLFVFLLLLCTCPLSCLAMEECAFSYQEPFTEEAISIQGFFHETERAHYYFSADIEAEARENFVKTQETLLEALQEKDFSCYILPDYEVRAESKSRTITLSPNEEDGGMGQAIATLQALHGEWQNYGLIFGAADSLCKEAGLPGYQMQFKDKGMLLFINKEENLLHFLLCYPSFTDRYTDETWIPFVKDMSVRVWEFLKEKGNAEALLLEKDVAAFQAEYIPLINEWLKSMKADPQLFAHLPAFSFAYSGKECPLRISAPHGEYHFLKDFSDALFYWNTSSFTDFFSTLWQAEDELSAIDKKLGQLPRKQQIFFSGKKALPFTGNYQHYQGEGPLLLSSLSSLAHEYLHASAMHLINHPDGWFLTELAATYFEMQFPFSVHESLYYILWDMQWAGEENEAWQPIWDAMKDEKNPLSSNSSGGEIYSYYCFIHEQYDLFTPSSQTLNSLRAFSWYLKEQYGDERVVPALISGDSQKNLGKSWEMLQAEWKDHLLSLYGQGKTL